MIGISSKQIRVVFVDIDDTLLSFSGYVQDSMRRGFDLFGLRPYVPWMYDVFEEINGELWRKIERGEIDFAGLQAVRWNAIFSALGIDSDGPAFETWFRAQLFSSAILVPGARELLEYLKPKYTLCAASNGPEAQQKNRLKVGGLIGFFDEIFVSSAIGFPKPSCEYFDACFQRLRELGLVDLKPEECMIIGDSETSDMAGGVNYGIRTCLYRPDLAAEKPAGVDFLVRRLDEVQAIL